MQVKIICTALLQQDRTSLSYMLQETEFLYVHFLTTKIWSSLITIFKQIAALQKTIKKNGRKKEISKTLLTHIIDGNLSQNANALTWSFWRKKILKNSKYKKGEGRIPCQFKVVFNSYAFSTSRCCQFLWLVLLWNLFIMAMGPSWFIS